MSWTPREIGTLIVVILKARHLPDKSRIGKQDPFCTVSLNGEKRRTKALKRGGQHPEWDEEVRITLFEDLEDELARTAENGDAPPPPPPKDTPKSQRKIKGGKIMNLSCYADDPREPHLIGEARVDLSEVLTKGETDEWFTLMKQDRYCGEVYLELTFWSNEPVPEKKSKAKPTRTDKQYGGPGSFVPTDQISSSPASGSENAHPRPRIASMSSIHDDNRSGSLPPSLRTSSSISTLDLYVPPYDQGSMRSQGSRISSMDQIADDFSELGITGSIRRRESFPPNQGYPPRPRSAEGYPTSLYSHQEYQESVYSDAASTFGYDRAVTPTPGGYPSAHELPLNGTYPVYQSPYETMPHQHPGFASRPPPAPSRHHGPRYSLPTSSSGFVPLSSTPAPSGFMSYPSHPSDMSGYAPPLAPTPTPMAYATYPPMGNGFAPLPAPTPVPSEYMAPAQSTFYDPYPQTPQSSFQPPVQSYSYPSYIPPPPPPSMSAPPQSYMPPQTPVSVPSPSHSAPPQGYHQTYGAPTPAPPHDYVPPPPPLTAPANALSSIPTSNSRPLPHPQTFAHSSPHRQSSLPIPPSTAPAPSPPSHQQHLQQMAYDTGNPSPSNAYVGAPHTPVPPPPPLQLPPGGNSPSYSPKGPLPPAPFPPPPPPPQFHHGRSPSRLSLPAPASSFPQGQTSPSGTSVPPPPPLPKPPSGQAAYPGPPPRHPSFSNGSSQWVPPPPPPPPQAAGPAY